MISLSKQNVSKETYAEVQKVLESGWWTMGKVTERLEQEFADYIGVKHAVAVNSCSMALWLAIQVNKLSLTERFCHVLTSPLTFCSTINAIIYNDLVPFLIDVDKKTQCIDLDVDLDSAEKYGEFYFQGIVPVHFAGQSCDQDTLSKLKEKYHIWIVEDCAHAIETKWRSQHVGTFGDCGCYSFNPTKNIAAPEMGMAVTNNDETAEKIRRLRIHGMDADASKRVDSPGRYNIVDLGYKANCTDLEAVIALQQLREVEDNWYKREDIWFDYNLVFDRFRKEGIFNGNTPIIEAMKVDRTVHGLHLYTIQLGNRDKFIMEMRKENICCGIHYKPIHLHPYYQERFGWKKGQFPNAEWIGEHTVSLPLGPGMTYEDVEYIVDRIHKILKKGDYLING